MRFRTIAVSLLHMRVLSTDSAPDLVARAVCARDRHRDVYVHMLSEHAL